MGCGPVGGYDPNAAAFIAAAGITNPTTALAWDAWFKGLKSLGLWTSLVEGWTYGLTMNPSESVIYGMKLLHEGTPTSDLIQDNYEIMTDAVLDVGVSTDFAPLPNSPGFTIVEVGRQISNPGGYGAGYGGGRNFMTICNQYYADVMVLQDGASYSVLYAAAGSGFVSSRRFRLLAVTGERAGICIVDGVSKAVSSADTDYSAGAKDTASGWLFNSGSVANPASIARSMTLYFNTDISASEAALRSLYKTTIGVGQGLP
jgi:hypothetical protein